MYLHSWHSNAIAISKPFGMSFTQILTDFNSPPQSISVTCQPVLFRIAFFEWVQNLNRDHWSEEEVNERLESKMTKAFYDVLGYAEKQNIDMRRAALVLAVTRVVSAMKMSGWH